MMSWWHGWVLTTGVGVSWLVGIETHPNAHTGCPLLRKQTTASNKSRYKQQRLPWSQGQATVLCRSLGGDVPVVAPLRLPLLLWLLLLRPYLTRARKRASLSQNTYLMAAARQARRRESLRRPGQRCSVLLSRPSHPQQYQQQPQQQQQQPQQRQQHTKKKRKTTWSFTTAPTATSRLSTCSGM